jgi:hypothetical protein
MSGWLHRCSPDEAGGHERWIPLAVGLRAGAPCPPGDEGRPRVRGAPTGGHGYAGVGTPEAGIDEVLATLDRDLVGLASVKKRIEPIAALLLVDRVRVRFGLVAPRPKPVHVRHRGPGDPARRRSACGWPSCSTGSDTSKRGPRGGRARRPGRAVHRPNGAADQEGPRQGHGRGAVHRRGVLPLRQSSFLAGRGPSLLCRIGGGSGGGLPVAFRPEPAKGRRQPVPSCHTGRAD